LKGKEKMKIVKLTAENYKRLSAVEITPDGNTVLITGKNESGKLGFVIEDGTLAIDKTAEEQK
jgi:hypothetical protein